MSHEFLISDEIDRIFRIATGRLPYVKQVKKFGFNPDVGATRETVWDGGGLYPWNESAQALTISSDDPADTLLGTGARTATVIGLDSNYAEYSITVELSGTTPVDVVANGMRVSRVKVDTAGSGGANAGELYVGFGAVSSGVPASTLAIIRPGYNQTQMALYTVPAGKVVFLGDYYNNTGKGKDAVVETYIRKHGEVFQLKRIVSAYQNNFYFPNRMPFFLDERTDIEIRATSVGSGAPVSAGFDMYELDRCTCFE
ncbi:MAG: hypothetical protein GY847_00260 [Proteobacteria bacterium]|nr:hypothetical protein [Pseudomonadota bacterium]